MGLGVRSGFVLSGSCRLALVSVRLGGCSVVLGRVRGVGRGWCSCSCVFSSWGRSRFALVLFPGLLLRFFSRCPLAFGTCPPGRSASRSFGNRAGCVWGHGALPRGKVLPKFSGRLVIAPLKPSPSQTPSSNGQKRGRLDKSERKRSS